MNKHRRREIERALSLVAEAKAILETCRDGEQDYFDNMPESFQSGEKGEAAEAAVALMDEAVSALDEIEANLGDMTA